MKQYIRNTFPEFFFENPVYWYRFYTGMVFAILLVTQLFTYERFHDVISELGLPGGDFINYLLAYGIPLLELVSLPYLLSMPIGSIWRSRAKTASIVVAVIWLALSVWQLFQPSGVNGGLFGATFPLQGGLWQVGYSLLLLAAVAVSYHHRYEGIVRIVRK